MNRNMIYLAIGALAMLCAAPSFAAKIQDSAQKTVTAPQKNMQKKAFATRKKALISDINARLDSLHKKQTCIRTAKDKASMRTCLNPSAPAHPAKKKPPVKRNGGH